MRYTLVSRRLVRRSKRERSTYHRLIRSSGCSSYYPCMNARFGTDPRRVSHGIARAETFKTYPANPSAVGEARRRLTTLSSATAVLAISFFFFKSPYTVLLLYVADGFTIRNCLIQRYGKPLNDFHIWCSSWLQIDNFTTGFINLRSWKKDLKFRW